MQKSTWGGLGAWMLALATGLISSGWPELIRPHPHIVIGLGIVGLLLFAYPGLKWVYQQQKGFHPHPDPWKNIITNESGNKFEASPVTNTGNFVGRDNSGHQIIAHNSTIHVAPNAPLPIAQPIVIERPPVSLELSFELKNLTYDLASCAWKEASQFDHESHDSLIAWFTYPVPPKGAGGLNTSGLTAHLKFSVPEHWSEPVNSAYWVGKSENRVSLKVGDRAGVIVGYAEGSRWVCFPNPYERPAYEEFLQPALRHPSGKKSMPKVEMNVELSLISDDSTTLEKKSFRLLFPGGTPYAAVHP